MCGPTFFLPTLSWPWPVGSVLRLLPHYIERATVSGWHLQYCVTIILVIIPAISTSREVVGIVSRATVAVPRHRRRRTAERRAVRATHCRQPAWERPDVRAALAIYLRSLIYRGIELYLRSLARGIEPYRGASLSPPRAD